MKMIPIGEVLKEYGYISEEQLQEALALQKKDRSKKLGEHLINMGAISESQMLIALSDKLRQPLVDLNQIEIDVKAVEKIPNSLAIKYNIIATSMEGNRLTVAINNPLDFYALEDIRLVTGMDLVVTLALKNEIIQAIDYYYSEIKAKTAVESANAGADLFELKEDELFNTEEDDTPVVKLLNTLLNKGYAINASDIHIEPFENRTLVRIRVDGMMVEYMQLSKNLHNAIVVRTKILSNLDIAEKRVPQDGHFVLNQDGVAMNLRVSIIPTVYGEKIVLRYLNSNTAIVHANQYGMNDDNYRKMKSMMAMPHGIIYMTGPTGSGKTTTLYMILEELAQKAVNISTIEDPVERHIDRINQMQVNNISGLTFESGLRALLRQDSDIMMVGETRDAQTASISVRAAITGHLVLSTLHTNDAISAIVRLEDMGVEPYMVANSLVGVVAQRLMRTVCPHCAKKIEATPEDQKIIGKAIDHVVKGEGCHYCNHTGYKGRIAIHEIIVIDKEVRRMISDHENIDKIYDYVKKAQNVVSLKDGAIKLVEEGKTTIEELYKITCYE
ncbi:MAG: type II/IV secretion system protein [Erysipelotrichia bacterium]|nr:type II/IV secretion system protein [Erysipelotrichia bacterium]